MYRAIKYCRILYAFYWRFAIYSHVRTKCIFSCAFSFALHLSHSFRQRRLYKNSVWLYKNSSQYNACLHLDTFISFFHFFRLIMTNLEMHFLSSFDRRRRRSLCALTSAFNVIFSLTSQCSIAFEIEAKENPQFHNKSRRHLLDVCSGWLWDGTGIERALKLFSSVLACFFRCLCKCILFSFPHNGDHNRVAVSIQAPANVRHIKGLVTCTPNDSLWPLHKLVHRSELWIA